jgi:hypothetical protein
MHLWKSKGTNVDQTEVAVSLEEQMGPDQVPSTFQGHQLPRGQISVAIVMFPSRRMGGTLEYPYSLSSHPRGCWALEALGQQLPLLLTRRPWSLGGLIDIAVSAIRQARALSVLAVSPFRS